MDSFVVPSAALACACIAASTVLLWRQLRGRPRTYRLVNLLFPAAQLVWSARGAGGSFDRASNMPAMRFRGRRQRQVLRRVRHSPLA